MLLRRSAVVGGELGGPVCIKYTTAVFLFTLWIMYLILSTLEVYKIIPGFWYNHTQVCNGSANALPLPTTSCRGHAAVAAMLFVVSAAKWACYIDESEQNVWNYMQVWIRIIRTPCLNANVYCYNRYYINSNVYKKIISQILPDEYEWLSCAPRDRFKYFSRKQSEFQSLIQIDVTYLLVWEGILSLTNLSV